MTERLHPVTDEWKPRYTGDSFVIEAKGNDRRIVDTSGKVVTVYQFDDPLLAKESESEQSLPPPSDSQN